MEIATAMPNGNVVLVSGCRIATFASIDATAAVQVLQNYKYTHNSANNARFLFYNLLVSNVWLYNIYLVF